MPFEASKETGQAQWDRARQEARQGDLCCLRGCGGRKRPTHRPHQPLLREARWWRLCCRALGCGVRVRRRHLEPTQALEMTWVDPRVRGDQRVGDDQPRADTAQVKGVCAPLADLGDSRPREWVLGEDDQAHVLRITCGATALEPPLDRRTTPGLDLAQLRRAGVDERLGFKREGKARL